MRVETEKTERKAGHPFVSRYGGKCPLGPDGAHTIRAGDLVVKVTPGFRWYEQKVSMRMKMYNAEQTTEYVHSQCWDDWSRERE